MSDDILSFNPVKPQSEYTEEDVRAPLTVGYEYQRDIRGPVSRKQWLKEELAKVKAGQPVDTWCVMGTPERIGNGLCLGHITPERMRRGQHTCSAECNSDYRRLRREELRRGECIHCGHGLTKTERERRLLVAEVEKLKRKVHEE